MSVARNVFQAQSQAHGQHTRRQTSVPVGTGSPLSLRLGHEEHLNKRASCGLLHHCLRWVLLVRSLTAHHPESCVTPMHPVFCCRVLAEPMKGRATHKPWLKRLWPKGRESAVNHMGATDRCKMPASLAGLARPGAVKTFHRLRASCTSRVPQRIVN